MDDTKAIASLMTYMRCIVFYVSVFYGNSSLLLFFGHGSLKRRKTKQKLNISESLTIIF